MTHSQPLIHHKLPPDAVIHTRQPEPPLTTDEDIPPKGYLTQGLTLLLTQLTNIARQAENRSHPVDEYNSAALSGAGSSASVTVPPTYEYMSEKIETIIITGPAGAITLLLGDRIWQLSIPATGVLVLGPMALLLSRQDARTLTAASAGTYTLELMGIADQRFDGI
jgi:hypothetical protein